MALAKIISWSSEPKSADIRRAAHSAIVSMFHTHTPQMGQIVANLPQMYQDNCMELLDKQLPPGSKGQKTVKCVKCACMYLQCVSINSLFTCKNSML